MSATVHTLRADHGQFLVAENGGGNEGELVGDPPYPKGLAVANRDRAGGPGDWGTIGIEVSDQPEFVGLYVETDQTDGRRYLCCENQGRDGIVVFNRPALGGDEKFRPVVSADGTRVSFESQVRPGYFVKAWPDGRVSLDQPMWEGEPTDVPGGYETFTADPPLSGSAAPVDQPLHGVITASYDQGVRDGTGSVLPRVLHVGDLLARFHYDRPGAERWLDEIGGAGWQAVRSWTVLRGSYWEDWGTPITPDHPWYWDNLRAFAQALTARGLRWLVSQGDLCAWTGQSGRIAFMQQLAHELKALGGNESLMFGVDCGNETLWNGEDDPQQLREVLDAFLAVLDTPIRTLTSWDEEHPNHLLVGDVQRDLHTGRWPWPQVARRVFNVGYEVTPHVFTMYSEPAGQGCQEYGGDTRVGHHVSATSEPGEWNDGDPEIQLAYAAIHAIAKGTFVCFMSPGVITDESFTNYPAFSLVPRLYAALPRDITAWTTFHGGENRAFSPDRILAVPADDSLDVRCDHAMGPNGQRVCVAYGPAGSYDLRVVNTFRGKLLDLDQLHAVDVAWSAGQVIQFSWKRAIVLSGVIGGAVTTTTSAYRNPRTGRGFVRVPPPA